jgi:AraC family transcriptional regulator
LLLKSFSGASIRRVIDRANARVPEHAHDWPVVSLFVIGAYTNHTELGELAIASPSAILYRAGATHRNDVSPAGFEQVEIEFDPAWLRSPGDPDMPVQRWIGGRSGSLARLLAQRCSGDASEEQLRAALRRLIECGAAERRRATPSWLSRIERRLQADPAASVTGLANEVGRHPSWLGSAYRLTWGEGIQETAARIRVERAARLLRETDVSLAWVASDTGFCDQSHMNRTFRRVLGRTPAAVRRERSDLRQAGPRLPAAITRSPL